MQAWEEDTFAERLVSRQTQLPHGLSASGGRKPTKRFAVYRNNVRGALVEALAVRYPVVQRLVGEDFFRAMAAEFAIQNLPASPVLIGYGADFPEFIETFKPAETLPFLADVARLESAYWQAYHAIDDLPLAASAFQSISPEALAGVRLQFIGACHMLSSPHPIVSIWQTNAADESVTPVDLSQPEDAMVTRPALSVEVRRLPAGAFLLLSQLQNGASLGEAANNAANSHANFDLTQNLTGLIQSNIVKAIIT